MIEDLLQAEFQSAWQRHGEWKDAGQQMLDNPQGCFNPLGSGMGNGRAFRKEGILHTIDVSIRLAAAWGMEECFNAKTFCATNIGFNPLGSGMGNGEWKNYHRGSTYQVKFGFNPLGSGMGNGSSYVSAGFRIDAQSFNPLGSGMGNGSSMCVCYLPYNRFRFNPLGSGMGNGSRLKVDYARS